MEFKPTAGIGRDFDNITWFSTIGKDQSMSDEEFSLQTEGKTMTFENLNTPTRELTPDELALLAQKDPEASTLFVTTDEETGVSEGSDGACPGSPTLN